MKNIALIFFCFLSIVCSAQNYQCLQFGPKNFFINGDNYLRGIRIDSIAASGTDTIFYPYHSIRSSNCFSADRVVDTEGGSWLGKRVIKQLDGTFLFDNIFHDTVIIKTQAGLGDSWPFFNDTTNVSYMATVTALDTMTILGMLDSIKVITITADSVGMLRANDPVNNFQIKLSKSNGFAQVFDLYTFPYHLPDSFSNINHIDYYLDLILGNLNICDAPICASIFPDTLNSIFHIIPFHNPTRMEIFDFAPGDIYEFTYEQYNESHYFTNYYYDQITSRSFTPYEVNYTGIDSLHNATIIVDYSGAIYTNTYNTSTDLHLIDTYPTDTSLLLNPNIMPEEKGSTYFYNYYPDYYVYDTTGCYTGGSVYVINNDHLRADGSVLVTGDGEATGVTSYSTTYAMGYGITNISGYEFQFNTTTTQQYTYIFKNGTACYGAYRLMANGVSDVNAPIKSLQIFPNPASDELTLKLTGYPGDHKISFTNALGQSVYQMNVDQLETKVNTNNFAGGIYQVTVIAQDGSRLTGKITIVH